MAQMIDESAMVVDWHVDETSKWFRDRLVSDLRSQNSLVNMSLKHKGLTFPQELCIEIERAPMLSRGFVYQLTKDMESLEFREIICTYTDFLYYLAGARAVNSEGVLPQENIIDFRLSDLSERATPLSENEVFFKIFVDIVKAATSTYFPLDLLDALSIPDVIALHSIAIDDHFVEKYNAIQMRTKQGLELQDAERLVLLMQELQEFERELHNEFTRAIQRELPSHLRELRSRRAADFIHSIASLVFTAYGMISGIKNILVSGLRLAGRNEIATGIENRIEERLDACSKIINQRASGERAILIAFIDKLRKEYTRKMFYPGQ